MKINIGKIKKKFLSKQIDNGMNGKNKSVQYVGNNFSQTEKNAVPKK